jgi:hypothetical protein
VEFLAQFLSNLERRGGRGLQLSGPRRGLLVRLVGSLSARRRTHLLSHDGSDLDARTKWPDDDGLRKKQGGTITTGIERGVL